MTVESDTPEPQSPQSIGRSLSGLARAFLPGAISADGTYSAPAGDAHEAALVTCRVAGLEGSAKVRVIPPLPWKWDFDQLADVPLTLTTPGAEQRLGGRAKGLADWESVQLDRPHGGTVTVTGVPAIHGPGSREDIEPFTGQVVGFVLTGAGLPTVYVSGDNASLDAVERIAERFGPIDTAVLFAGAPRFAGLFDGQPLVLDSAQAAEATKILRARRVVPVHYEGWAHFTEGRDDLDAAFAAAGLSDRLQWN